MKKLFIGLLIAAAGTAFYFFILQKKENQNATALNKEWLLGSWVHQEETDSTRKDYIYDFQKDGKLLQTLNDSANKKVDTLHYEWNKSNELVWKQKKEDTVSRIFQVVQLTKDSLQIMSKDSIRIVFTRK